MKFWVGVTDNDWYRFLARLDPPPDEVNFWQPGGQATFTGPGPGGLFLFKPHIKHEAGIHDHFIAGGGVFLHYSVLPLSLAWSAFGEKNGAPDQAELLRRIARYAGRKRQVGLDPAIGCGILSRPFFLPRDRWVRVPDWRQSRVQGSPYDSAHPVGAVLWTAVMDAIGRSSVPLLDQAGLANELGSEDSPERREYVINSFVRPGSFRVLVTDAYQRRCAFTGEKVLPVLHAGHIKPVNAQGPHHVSNGILMRSDIHTLFDAGYMTVKPDLTVAVSRRIRTEYHNGEAYYTLNGRPLVIRPRDERQLPARDFLQWHNDLFDRCEQAR